MNLQNRIDLLTDLGKYLRKNGEMWQQVKKHASNANHWFTEEFIDLATHAITNEFLTEDNLIAFSKQYHLDDHIQPAQVGIVMAGNIPLVGFHDFLCVFLCGHRQKIKLSSKDNILIRHIIEWLTVQAPELLSCISIDERLSGCDAYIATGSNSSADVFETYFGKYPSIIRRNRTSIAILNGQETSIELEALADDIHLYFGLGCRNVTKILVPEGYDFIPLIKAFAKYDYFRDHHSYTNNYDYQLSLLLLNNITYMSSQSTLIIEHKSPFSPISVLHYETYPPNINPMEKIVDFQEVQAIIGNHHLPFGAAQQPRLNQFADGADTMAFLLGI